MSGAWIPRGGALPIAAALLILAAACGPQDDEGPPAVDTGPSAAGGASGSTPAEREVPDRVRKAAAIARAIQADPSAMDRILENEGMTREELEDLLYEIAADPALSEAYIRELRG